MDGLQTVEYQILKEFVKICKNNHLQYFLVEGSALGAVRHHGFIPWDDDIDVGLPRKDYIRFLEIAQESLPDYYFLRTYETDPAYHVSYAKIRDSRTTFIETSVKDWKINHGVFIDVFPLDYYPESNRKWFRFVDLLQKARLSTSFSSSASPKMKVLQTVSKVLYPNLRSTLFKRDKHLRSVENSGKMTNHFSAWKDKEIMPAEYYGKGTPVQFEDITVLVPENYDGYLQKLYGDYMTPPPVEQRVAHHYSDVIDLEKPYTAYV